MTRLRYLRRFALAILLGAFTLQCSDNTQPPSATSMAMAGGNGQSGVAGQPLDEPLAVRVTDAAGDPVQGVSVRWQAQGGGSVSAETVTTGSDGRASVQRVLGPEPGEQTTTASANGLEGSPVTFVATATGGESQALVMETQPSGNAQSGVEFAVQPVIRLRDAEGADLPQSGLAVTASIDGNGTGTLGGTLTQSTDESGLASFTDLKITGPAGSYVLRFSAPGTTAVVSTPITISAGAATLLITANPPVSALSGEVFDPVVQPVVEVKDAGGSSAAGVEVTATIASGSGTLEGDTTAISDEAGVARFGDLGISGSGAHSLEFTAGGASVTSSPVNISALPPEASSGKWGSVVAWNIVPLHMNLLPNGKILAWGKTDAADTMGMPRLWDPAAGSPSALPMIPVDTMLFCAGHALLPDGRLMVAGGHLQDDRGIATTYFFNGNGSPQRGPDMAHGRWYPTLTALPDGRMLTMAGRNAAGTVVRVPEIWENNQWVQLPGANGGAADEIPYYPRNFVAPNGRVFYAGERVSSRWFDVDASGAGGGRGRWTDGPNHIWPNNRDYGTAVMYDAGKILYAGGGGHTSWPTPDPRANAPTATVEVIDLNQASPSWQNTSAMSSPRRHLNSTILPDGQVLVTGGTRGGGFVNIDPGLAVREAEVWNPGTGQWTTLAANSRMRVYHSVSLLLPDGTVLHGASGDAMAVQPGGAIVEVPPERNHEIFSPPYLFKGARPTITSVPATVSYGAALAVSTPNAAQVTDVRWIRLGAVTHAFDMGQRANTLSFTRTSSGVEVAIPAGPNLAPPGHYQLFILNRNGVPSEGRIVQLQ